MRTALLIACVGLVCGGCTVTHGTFPCLTTRDVGSDIKVPDKSTLPTVEGKSSGFHILGFPIVVPAIGEAVEDALKKGNGDLLVDAVVKSYSYDFSLVLGLMGSSGWRVEGKVVKVAR